MLKPLLILMLCGACTFSLNAQSTNNEPMDGLEFMIGNWIGTSAQINNDTIIKQVAAHQKISYDLERSIVIIDHKSESLQLHTIVHYDKNDSTYYYTPYSSQGVRKLRAELVNGDFVVNASSTKRFVFRRLDDNSFTEFGEKFENGKWSRYFEDRYIIVQ